MTFALEMKDELGKFSLLNHSFYQAWSEGKIDVETLKIYAGQYFHHVNAFPRYISAIHSSCHDIKARQVLLENLIDEEQGEENHPELWLRFAESLGASREEVQNAKLNEETAALVNNFFELSHSSYAKGIGALYAYENQVPEVAKSKIEGLQKFYSINDERGLKFFREHITADEWHSQECSDLIDALPENERQEAKEAAITAAKSLWKFLDGMEKVRLSSLLVA